MSGMHGGGTQTSWLIGASLLILAFAYAVGTLAARRRNTASGNDDAGGTVARAVRDVTSSARDFLSGRESPPRTPGATPTPGSAGGR